MKTILQWLEMIKGYLEIPLVKLKGTEITLWTLFYIIVLIFLLFYLTGKLKKWVIDRLLAKFYVDIGVRSSIGSIVRYFVIAVGFVIILQTAGIDLTALTVVAGALGLGLGFGLQNIVSNFVSGIIILFERPIKVGDRLEVGNVSGTVQSIDARSTTLLTNDNISIIIPNSKFIQENIINWSHDDWKVRFSVPVSVSYGSDVHLVEKLLLEAVEENSDVLKKPGPAVRFVKFGDNGLIFELRVWTTSLIHRKGMLVSAVNFAIYDKLTENGIELPTASGVDLRVLGGSLDVKIREPDAND
ncbi:MAG TPA: mechanosensitive ion channel domain-containing protein [Geobacteraceae bacterium]|nr:mechanosensitive ion channel domain-containing protein [Geobacteraceae bacterium]